MVSAPVTSIGFLRKTSQDQEAHGDAMIMAGIDGAAAKGRAVSEPSTIRLSSPISTLTPAALKTIRRWRPDGRFP